MWHKNFADNNSVSKLQKIFYPYLTNDIKWKWENVPKPRSSLGGSPPKFVYGFSNVTHIKSEKHGCSLRYLRRTIGKNDSKKHENIFGKLNHRAMVSGCKVLLKLLGKWSSQKK